MEYYCLGFLFWGPYVLLIKKNRPDWQRHKLNGLGGKVNYSTGESPREAMNREYKEESGYKDDQIWREVCRLSKPNWTTVVFAARTNSILGDPPSPTDEKCVWSEVGRMHEWCDRAIPNLQWLIPLAEQTLDEAVNYGIWRS